VVLKYEFCYETKIGSSFRCKSLIGQYDLEQKDIKQTFKGELNLPEKWSVGLIVGNSGSGKTSIAKQLFGQFEHLKWDDRPLIDNFADNLDLDQITTILGSVGFNSVPYWLKPYSVLSNGEKQRVSLARMISEKDFIVFDEFSSMVDRDVAKAMSNSVNKIIRKLNKQIVCISCHKDLSEWLLPDWVLDTDSNVFFCPTNQEQKSFNSTLIKSQNHVGTSIKSITI
jgi:ABC-type ATPase with predicted acetyltransferase domain